jgi:hypothetical protein
MATLTEACNISTSVKNSGVGCSAAMLATAQIIAGPLGLKIPANALLDFQAWVNTQMHAAPGSRIYPFFGSNAPIRTLNANDSADVEQTFDDGSKVFITSGFANRTYETDAGGLCYAAVLRSFLNSGYGFIELDKTGQVTLKKNSDGTYGFFPCYMGGGTPTAATFKTKYMNKFSVSYDPDVYVNSGKIFKGAEAVLDLMGLQDVELASGAAATTTTITITAIIECGGIDLIALLSTPLAQVSNFVLTDKAGGTHPTVTAVAIVNGKLQFTGTFVTGHTYNVAFAAPSVLFTNGIQGYDGAVQGGVDITV